MKLPIRSAVMPALVAGIHVFPCFATQQDVDGRDGAPRALARGDPDKPGHDEPQAYFAAARRGHSSICTRAIRR